MRNFIILFTTMVLFACTSTQNTAVVQNSKTSVNEGDDFFKKKMYQEAAWAYCKSGTRDDLHNSLKELYKILSSQQVKIAKLGTGVAESYTVTFKDGHQGIFKPIGADKSGKTKHEVAAFAIDTLLEICLTPLTIMRKVTLPDGSVTNGSIMYFIKNVTTAQKNKLTIWNQPYNLLLFDVIIGNYDRNSKNWVVKPNKEFVAIDHNRAFYFDNHFMWKQNLRNIKDFTKVATQIDLYKKLTEADFKKAIHHLVGDEVFKKFMARRKEALPRMKNP